MLFNRVSPLNRVSSFKRVSLFNRMLLWLQGVLAAVIVLFFLTWTYKTYANDLSFTDPLDGKFDMSQAIADNPYAFIPVPVILTEPALGYGGGLFGLFLHESDDASAKRKQLANQSQDGGARFTPPNLTVVGGAKTENGTWFAGIAHRHTWAHDTIRYRGFAGYANINMDIYQQIYALPVEKSLSFQSQTQGFGGRQQISFKLGNNPLYVGIAQAYFQTEIGAKEARADQILTQLVGEKSTTSGLGVVAEYDTRDNIFYPTKGSQIEAEYMMYRDGLGSDDSYDTFEFDGQHFIPLASDVTLGLAMNYQSLTGERANLPPLAKPYIALRGIASYRYQGGYVLTGQTQVMWQFDPRWTVQGFVGVGSSAAKAKWLYQDSEMAYGAGIRYLAARRFGLKTGIDVAFSDEDSALYFNVGTGF